MLDAPLPIDFCVDPGLRPGSGYLSVNRMAMNRLVRQRLALGLAISLAGWGLGPVLAQTNVPVQFNRSIRPILADQCLVCHGPDAAKRKADLRLDTPEGAGAVHKGRQAIKPRDLNQSELWRRINSTDPKVQMPPPDSGKKLKPSQVALLRQWIEEGAVYQKHWSFEAPVRPPVPEAHGSAWPRNELDRFLFAALEARQIQPGPEAPKAILLRRLTLDLTGLPPTPAEVDAFTHDNAPDAYDRAVERLLSSPRYGEHMARYWLDVARYGDTHGLHLDNERSLWPYRDWVVTAFNQNLRFDQFTIWQLAGDLLPQATREQQVASGFNRCNVSTSEGGAIDEEFQVRYAVDRVETTSTAWLGLTMGCAVCHDHKLDPITQKEFYQVFTLFNNISEKPMDGNALLPPPTLKLPTPDQEKSLAGMDAHIKELKQQVRQQMQGFDYVDPATQTDLPPSEPKEIVWIDDELPPKAEFSVNTGNEPFQWTAQADGPVYSGARSIRRSGKGIDQVFFQKCDQPLTIGGGDKLFAYVYLDPKSPPKAIMLQYFTEEWRSRANWGDEDAIGYGNKGTAEKVLMGGLPEAGKWVRLEVSAARLGLRTGNKVNGMAFTIFDGTAYWDKAGQISINHPAEDPGQSFVAWKKVERDLKDKSTAPEEIRELLKKKPAELKDADRQSLRDYFLEMVYARPPSGLLPLRTDLKSTQEKRDALDKEVVATMVSKELDKPRPAWVLVRGQYDKHGDPVAPGVPAVLPPLPQAETTNRLTFARWLVEPQHPLTARVTVNRFWQQFFGIGLVKTAEDFGTKGEWPSNPELLDWLATEFMRSGWDVKHLVRLMVTSAAYRQDSHASPELVALDPENRLLGRGPRFRLDAEVLRDEALYVSGLLNLAMGGRGVHPYQPGGVWEAVGYTTSNTAKYSQDHGDALYRRSLYTLWKRTAPPPSMTTFDAPSREQCRARRERTNTPLQALLTMNDPQYLEAARQLGFRMLHEGGAADVDRLGYGFRLAAARAPSDQERAVLEASLAAQRAHYQAHADAAAKLIAVGESPAPKDVPATELAAYTMVANLLLNLDEVLTKN